MNVKVKQYCAFYKLHMVRKHTESLSPTSTGTTKKKSNNKNITQHTLINTQLIYTLLSQLVIKIIHILYPQTIGKFTFN